MMLSGEMTVIENDFEVELEKASAARIVKFEIPATRGAPVMAPVEERARPDGNAPALRLKPRGPEPPLAAMVTE